MVTTAKSEKHFHQDIRSLDDIKTLVNTFYERVQNDDLIGPVFNDVIQDRWPSHLEKMHRFWQTVLLYEHTYSGSPFPPHAKLPIDKKHFERWLNLFNRTVDELFAGENAEKAKLQAHRMALTFEYKIDYLRNEPRSTS